MPEEIFPAKGRNLEKIQTWANCSELPKISYTCGYCGNLISNARGYFATIALERVSRQSTYIHVCHICQQPTHFNSNGEQYPIGTVGRAFKHVPDDLLREYIQTQKCLKAECLEASVMVARRLLMVLAWRLNADEGKSFQDYVEHFVAVGAISPAMKVWVDKIRQIGNASNHKILSVTQDDAKMVLQFIDLIFDNVFEAPASAGVASPFTLRV